MTRNCHFAGLGWMHELTVTAFFVPEYPPVFGENLEDIAYLHGNCLPMILLPRGHANAGAQSKSDRFSDDPIDAICWATLGNHGNCLQPWHLWHLWKSLKRWAWVVVQSFRVTICSLLPLAVRPPVRVNLINYLTQDCLPVAALLDRMLGRPCVTPFRWWLPAQKIQPAMPEQRGSKG